MRNKILEHVLAIIDLSEKEQDEFLSILKEIKIAKKSFLIRPGDVVTEEYFVVKGCLVAYYLDELGNKHILQFAVEDWWISDFESFFNEVPA
ncbi:Crp/Fnr family transcriptional regulator, partial [Mesonia mobilis]